MKTLLYADDTKCIHTIATNEDPLLLQEDLNSLSTWSKSNLSFNLQKTVLLQFSCSKSPVVHDYQLNETSINCKDHYKDLGVIFSHDLSWSKHISSIVAKAYKTLALIRRTFHHSTTSVSVRKTLYMSLIRSQLTYCSPVWRPHLIEDIKILEKVQRRATKWILQDYSSDLQSEAHYPKYATSDDDIRNIRHQFFPQISHLSITSIQYTRLCPVQSISHKNT